MFSIEECRQGVEAAMGVPDDEARKISDGLTAQSPPVVGHWTSRAVGAAVIAEQLHGMVSRRPGPVGRYVVAPWCVGPPEMMSDGTDRSRGIALWLEGDVSQNAYSDGTIT